MASKKPTAQDLMRLDDIAKHLRVKSRFPQSTFNSDVKAACLARVAPIVDKLGPCRGEDVAQCLGEHLHVTFEEVHGPQDIIDLETRYLKGKKELGFAQLRDELNPRVDALLFQRMHATEHDPDRWVAVLNLQESRARAYWNRFHELSHRIAEPPQMILPFRRHQFEASNPVEMLVDSIAAEFAFYGPVFRPLVEEYAKRYRLSFAIVDAIKTSYAPTASLLSTMNAVVTYWPRPAAALTAEFRGRLSAPGVDKALRVSLQSSNERASQAGLSFFPNMRVPDSSPIHASYAVGQEQDADEHLGDWTTSQGKSLAAIDVYTSARNINGRIYALIAT